jgi:hypothetical protein
VAASASATAGSFSSAVAIGGRLLDALPQEKLTELQTQWKEGADKDKIRAAWSRSETVTAQGRERRSKEKASGQLAGDGDIPFHQEFPAQLDLDFHVWLISVFPELTACFNEAKQNCGLGIDDLNRMLSELDEAVKRDEVAARAKGGTETEAEAATKRAGRGALMAMRVCGQTLK